MHCSVCSFHDHKLLVCVCFLFYFLHCASGVPGRLCCRYKRFLNASAASSVVTNYTTWSGWLSPSKIRIGGSKLAGRRAHSAGFSGRATSTHDNMYSGHDYRSAGGYKKRKSLHDTRIIKHLSSDGILDSLLSLRLCRVVFV